MNYALVQVKDKTQEKGEFNFHQDNCEHVKFISLDEHHADIINAQKHNTGQMVVKVEGNEPPAEIPKATESTNETPE